MNAKMKKCIIAIIALMSAVAVQADVIANWKNNALAGNEASAPANDVLHADVASAVLTRGAESSTYPNVFAMRSGDEVSLAAAITANRYIAVTLTADSGMYFDSFSEFWVRLEANNIPNGREIAIFSSETGFTAGDELYTIDLYDGGAGPGQYTQHAVDLSGVTALQANTDLTTVEFRIYNWGSSSQWNALGVGRGYETWQDADDLTIQGTVSVIPEPSTLALLGIALGSAVFFRRRKH